MTDHPLDTSVESRTRANPHVRFGGRRRGNRPAKAGHGASPSTPTPADHRFLTCVADHATGAIMWAARGRNAATLQAFFAALSDEQKASIQAVSIDMSAGYEKAIRAQTDARVCFDPFHVVALCGRAVDKVRRAEWNEHGRSGTAQGTWVKGVRWSLLKAPEKAQCSGRCQQPQGSVY